MHGLASGTWSSTLRITILSVVIFQNLDFLGQIKVNHFWKRWCKEYLSGRREAHAYVARKHSDHGNPPVTVGDTVIVSDDSLLHGHWNSAKKSSPPPSAYHIIIRRMPGMKMEFIINGGMRYCCQLCISTLRIQ